MAIQAQNVGIGTLNPLAKLHLSVLQAGDSTGLRFSAGGQNALIYIDSNDLILRKQNMPDQLVLDQSGNIGMGTHHPQASLHIKASSPEMIIEGSDPVFRLRTEGVNLGNISHLSNNLSIRNQMDGSLYLGTNGGTNLTILSNGNTGIGTTSPADDLHVKGNYGWMRVDGADPAFSFYNGTDYLGYLQTTADHLRIQNRKPGKTFLGNNNLIQVTVNTDGLVGLGTQFPEAKLHLSSPNEGAASGILLSALNDTQHSEIYNKDGNMHLRIQGVSKQMVLTPDGGVGIGTESPDALFHVKSGSSPHAGIFQNSASSGTWLGIGNVGSGGKYFQLISTGSANNGGAGDLLIYSSNDWNTATTLAMAINGSDGRVAIGTLDFSTGYKLSVAGKIITDGLRVQATGSWPDYVFEPTYDKPTLNEVASFIGTHGHLPGFDPAAVVESQGLDMETITVQQQEWIEVSTLYILEQDKRIEALERLVKQQTAQIDLLLNHIENK